MSETSIQNEHDRLTGIALRWLKRAPSSGGPGCSVALSECKTGPNGEIPDAIGFRRTGHGALDGSVLVEVKASRADFLADGNKIHRTQGGVGSWRYYMAPAGLICVDELPEKWGLLEINNRGHVKPMAGHALYFKGRHSDYLREADVWRFKDADLAREQYLLVRTLANTGDAQKVLNMLRETNNIRARLVRRISAIGVALGLNKESPSVDVEQRAHSLHGEHQRVLKALGFNPNNYIFDLEERLQKLVSAVPQEVHQEVIRNKPLIMVSRCGTQEIEFDLEHNKVKKRPVEKAPNCAPHASGRHQSRTQN